ncbi:putative receptor-like protein kinase At4g00960 [Olea europaea var. sylvestris]|uniref:putative receptor-like protein kinase At4g00960 n=1 Tax=Olea europaea var. sylvestris TaxID=158386 RepID=UPI000C1D2C73|nr:putative receptor-like protein kinase At4g00960 [Olea europaea var. sylvestris]
MSSRKWLPNFILLICLINLVVSVKSEFPTTIHFNYKCLDNGNYTSSSTYKTNLDTLLSTVSPNIDNNGFYNASTGENSDRVNVIALCRADLQPYQCHDYVKNATVEILKKCPNQKQAFLWHEFCMVRYSNETIFRTPAYDPFDFGYSEEKVTNLDKFYQELNILLDSLRNQTAYNSSPKKFAAASRVNRDYETTYAFEQCTPDITPKECDDCLKKSLLRIRECCDEAGGVRILRPSCYLRFETDFPFYNETMVEILQTTASPMPPPSLSPPQPPPGKDDNTTRNVIIVIVPIVVCLILGLCIGIILRTKKTRKPLEKIETDNETSTIESLQYDFSTIRAATENFSDANKLGQGGFGGVYKGKMPKGIEIAVKRLSRDLGQGDLEFKNEVLLLTRLQHRNLVRLLGFSVEGSERLLIYEWVQNGSLDRFIFDPNMHPYLDWGKRYIIIGGVAKGLLYLHEDSRLQIIHRDLKASNVLLDGEMKPKISDFGMARLFVPEETQHSTSRIVGTYGYMAPEYVMHGQFSVKSDVFSFGVLVLEIICGQKTNNFRNRESMDDLLSCVWKNWHEGTAANIIDPVLRASLNSLRDILRCIHIGLLCVQENSTNRPTMASVVLMLSSSSLTLSVPLQPAFFLPGSFDLEISLPCENGSSNDQSNNNAHLSTNDVSMSELYPR